MGKVQNSAKEEREGNYFVTKVRLDFSDSIQVKIAIHGTQNTQGYSLPLFLAGETEQMLFLFKLHLDSILAMLAKASYVTISWPYLC